MVKDKGRRTTIAILQQTKHNLDSIRHPGQSYEGVIQELLKFWKKEHGLDETVGPLDEVERGKTG